MKKTSKYARVQLIVYYVAMVVCILIGIINTLTIGQDSSTIVSALIEVLMWLEMGLLIVILCLAIMDIFYAIKKYRSRAMDELLAGVKKIKLFNEQYPNNQIGKIHYILQLLPCVDIVSSVILLRKFNKIVK